MVWRTFCSASVGIPVKFDGAPMGFISRMGISVVSFLGGLGLFEGRLGIRLGALYAII